MSNSDTVCKCCENSSKRAKDKERHKHYCTKNKDSTPQFICDHCDKGFRRKDAFVRHVGTCRRLTLKRKNLEDSADVLAKSIHLSDEYVDGVRGTTDSFECIYCNVHASNYYVHLKSLEHRNKVVQESDDHVRVEKKAFDSRIVTYRVRPRGPFVNVGEFMISVKVLIVKCIIRAQTETGVSLKINLEIFCEYMRNDIEIGTATDVKSFTTDNELVTLADDLGEVYDAFACQLTALGDEFQEDGSGWAVSQILYADVNVYKYSPFKGSSYLPLPRGIAVKKACINVNNKDEACFFWAVTSALYPVETHSDRVSSYPHYSKVLKTDNIPLPVTLYGIKKFEKLNDISVNVYETRGSAISGVLYYRSKKRDRHVNLLFIEDGERTHYCWIKNLNKLVARQVTKNTKKRWVCDDCFMFFGDENELWVHKWDDCSKVQADVPPPKKRELQFKNYRNQLRTPVVVYANLESLLRKMNTCSSDPHGDPFTHHYQLHEPHSCGFYIRCSYDESKDKYVKSCAKSFLDKLNEELEFFSECIKVEKPMCPLTETQKNDFKSTEACSICYKDLGSDRVKDHCHFTGNYRGAAHRACNVLMYRVNKAGSTFVPVVIHNLSKYDAHFIVTKLTNEDIRPIARNKQHFISFTIQRPKSNLKFHFIDSYTFLSCGLDKLASNLDDAQFNIVKKEFSGTNMELVMKKGVFPYDYVDSLERLDETSLPPRDSFYNKLDECEITEEEYSHAQEVWKRFNIQTLGEYSDLYMKTDLLLLADVFENFRNLCLDTYKLDPCHYVTAAGFSWDAMLRFTGVKMELLKDVHMIKFIQEGIRGGLSHCNVRYSKANNKYMRDYDSHTNSRYIICFDSNNQYGWAMAQFLPIRDFRWLQKCEIDELEVTNLEKKSENGYILEVDLEYPLHLHNLHNDLPFCPDRKRTESNKVTKLISDLTNKEKYVIHYIHLQEAIRNGLILKKIHRVLGFTQSPWLKPYIEANINKRMESKKEFEKKFYKLMNNSVYEKIMENVKRRVDIELVNTWEGKHKRRGAGQFIARPNFHSCTILTDILCFIQMSKTKVIYDKPIYVEFSVLELSKTLMYEFHYDYMKHKYGDEIKLMYTDTDSFIYEINTNDFYKDIKVDLEDNFDTSDYPKDNLYKFPLVNEKVLGKFKDKYAGDIVKEFIGVRSKCCYVASIDGATGEQKETKRAKGVKKDIVKYQMLRDVYFKAITEGGKQYMKMNTMHSKDHGVFSETIRKVALDGRDDKRFAIPDSFYTLAWGHRYAGNSPFI